MTDWGITAKKTITAFFAAGGATFVASFLQQYPQDFVIYGSLSIGALAAAWRAITNAYKHKDDK